MRYYHHSLLVVTYKRTSTNFLQTTQLFRRFFAQSSTSLPISDAETSSSTKSKASALNATTKRNKAGQKIMQFQALRIYTSSPGTLLDPFVPRTTVRPFLSSLFTKEGLKEHWQYLKARVKAKIGAFMIKKRLKGWNPHEFTNEAENIYIQMNEALAQSDKNRLRELTTESYHRELRNEWSRLNPEKGIYSVWKYAGRVDKPQIVHLVVAQTHDKKAEFAQITIKLHSLQSLDVYSKEHHALSSKLGQLIPVNDLLVYERNLMDPNARWRICARLLPNNSL